MAEFPIENINNMLKYVEKEIFMPGDYITRAGTPGSCMYFILNGTVAVYTYYGVEVFDLKLPIRFNKIEELAYAKQVVVYYL